jgi:tRNA uridine 5-carbamoylmethylation protein Kti12
MKKLIMTIGLPGSGKTTWAREYAEQMREVGERVDIVCKDDIRKAMSATGWVWSKSGEVEVLKMRDSLIKSAFSHGVSVVISTDTNFGGIRIGLRSWLGSIKQTSRLRTLRMCRLMCVSSGMASARKA